MNLRLSNIALLAVAGLWLTSGAAIATDSPPPHPAKVIEHDQVAHEKTVGSPLRHCQARFFSFGRTGDANRR